MASIASSAEIAGPAATGAGHMSLANMGLLAAPTTGLLTGSVLADSAGPAGSSNDFVANRGFTPSTPARAMQPALNSVLQGSELNMFASLCAGRQQEGAAAAAVGAGILAENRAGSAAEQGNLSLLQQQGQQARAAAPNSKGRDDWEPASAGTKGEASSGSSSRPGSAAFKSTSRQQASRVGRVKESSTMDMPGPGQYRPHHTYTDKYVKGPQMAAATRPTSPNRAAAEAAATADMLGSSSIALHEQQQQQQQCPQQCPQQQTRQLPMAAADPAGTASVLDTAAAAARGSLADTTPRIGETEAIGPPELVPVYVHPRSQVKQGTAAFKSVSREQLERRQRPVSASAGANQLGADHFHDGYDHLIWCTNSPAANFAKQTARPASPSSFRGGTPANLGPGAYHKSCQLPSSYTGADVAAGHVSSAGTAPDFAKYSSRPGSAAGGAAAGSHQCSSMQNGWMGAAGWPGVCGWVAAAAGAHVVQADHLASTISAAALACTADLQQQQQPAERPSSRAALNYARQQYPTNLVRPRSPAGLYSNLPGISASALGVPGGPQAEWDQQQQQQYWMYSTNRSAQQHKKAARSMQRPASAMAILQGGSPGSWIADRQQHHNVAAPQRPGSSSSNSPSKGGVLGQQDLQRYSSTGFATRVKGGGFSKSSRAAAGKGLRVMGVGSVVPPSSVAVKQAGAECSYEPKPEQLGHMHKPPGWKLPSNRVANSKKWARLAAQAALQ